MMDGGLSITVYVVDGGLSIAVYEVDGIVCPSLSRWTVACSVTEPFLVPRCQMEHSAHSV